MGGTERKLAIGERNTRVYAILRFNSGTCRPPTGLCLLYMHLLRSIQPLTNVKLTADILSGAVSLYD